MTAFDDAVREARERIQQYIEAHPEAADTAEGIATWWLSGLPAPAVQAALDDLVRRGVMQRHVTAGGRQRYSRATPP
jgi:hypothetical protein